MHEGDEPDALADLGDADVLPGKHVAEIHLHHALGQPLVIDSRLRAGGRIGIGEMHGARLAKPDMAKQIRISACV